jgi:hypothetical protein
MALLFGQSEPVRVPAMGRKSNRSKAEQFTISVSKDTWEYLEYMAINGIIGASVSIIASTIVTNEIHQLKKIDFFNRKVPGQ